MNYEVIYKNENALADVIFFFALLYSGTCKKIPGEIVCFGRYFPVTLYCYYRIPLWPDEW